MAAGKPVISSAIGGTDEAVIDGQTGLLVRPGDATALATAVRALLAEPELARRLAKAGQERVTSHFSSEAMASQVERIYEAVLARHGRRDNRLSP
jgi:glycosyltransferase involved in cell wall biosynthesis